MSTDAPRDTRDNVGMTPCTKLVSHRVGSFEETESEINGLLQVML